jgi:hypothetical protein
MVFVFRRGTSTQPMPDRRTFNIVWTYYKSTLLVNVFCSLALPFADFPNYIEYFPQLFGLSFITLGLLVSFVYKEFVRREEYYFYYNAHVSRLQLYLACFLTNLPIAVLLISINA